MTARRTFVVGSLPSVTAGEWLVAEGWWVRDKEHGLWANLPCRARTQKWVEMGAAHVEQDYFRLADRTYAMAHIRFQENYVPFVCGSTMPDEFWFQ